MRIFERINRTAIGGIANQQRHALASLRLNAKIRTEEGMRKEML